MRLTLLTASAAALLATGAGAETIGVTMQSFDNNFQTLLRHGIIDRATQLEASTFRSRTRRPTWASRSTR